MIPQTRIKESIFRMYVLENFYCKLEGEYSNSDQVKTKKEEASSNYKLAINLSV